MGKTSERIETYQTQMSIYAEQHKIILANDVLDMIEQLQDDLKDDIEKVVAELEKQSYEIRLEGGALIGNWHSVIDTNIAIAKVRKGGVE